MEVIFTNEAITAPQVALPSREVGACVEFWGIVREQEGDRTLAGLHYEAYEPMARREFDRIAGELQEKHPITGALVIHRLGWVSVGEPSLFVRVLAKNRGPALGFCGDLIDRMKLDVPIWKVA
jgi:molybdopterin synthase catalytic subunit